MKYFLAGFFDQPKIFSIQAIFFRKHLDGQLLATSKTAGFKDFTATDRFHAGSKPMFSGSFNFFGLPSAFGHGSIIQ